MGQCPPKIRAHKRNVKAAALFLNKVAAAGEITPLAKDRPIAIDAIAQKAADKRALVIASVVSMLGQVGRIGATFVE